MNLAKVQIYMNRQLIIEEQIKWIQSGQIGCIFASALLKYKNEIGWSFIFEEEYVNLEKDFYIISILFENKNVNYVKGWALQNNFFIEKINEECEGLRIKIDNSVAWVQYFGFDSHVATRRSPHSMLMYTNKIPKLNEIYNKVGFNGILHLANASIKHFTQKKCDTMWEQSYIKTKKIITHTPTIKEAAKTTFLMSK